nr:hypothetical protein [Xanthomonadales bacterium]NIX11673.1 hypothetical protein [Xanthomonadales bacterium]
MDLRILIAALATLLAGPLHAQDNIALGSHVEEIGGPFGVGAPHPGTPPGVVTDNHFEQLGADWLLGSWWVDEPCVHFPPPTPDNPEPGPEPCSLEIHLPGWFEIESFIFQGDNDAYLLEYWHPITHAWVVAWEIPSGAGGLETRPDPYNDSERWPVAPFRTNRLRVRVDPGGILDNEHSVSEVQAFGHPIDPCTAMGGTPVGDGCSSGAPRFETHVAAGEICYRFEFSCDGFVSGGFGACIYDNGFFDFGMGAQVGDPHPPVPGEPECGFGGAHMLND